MSIYDLFEKLAAGPPYLLTSKTLASIQDYFFGYTAGLDVGNIDLTQGEPPFSEFNSWVARRFGKSKKSIYYRWTEYTGSWWRIIEEQFGNGEHGFDAFFALVAEFRQRKRILKGTTVGLSQADLAIFDTDNPTQLEAIEYVPNDGHYLIFVYGDGRRKVEGFYSTLEELLASAAQHYKISINSWDLS